MLRDMVAESHLRVEAPYVDRLCDAGVPVVMAYGPEVPRAAGYVYDRLYCRILHACGWRQVRPSQVSAAWKRLLWMLEPDRLAQLRLGADPQEMLAERAHRRTRTRP